ncbi:hypothetical protein NMY22_g13686 [Coprinellus aureogranulatus]|nr:hypothetical protein NMY22_g13686 [Coprinellus aureogranulatus]
MSFLTQSIFQRAGQASKTQQEGFIAFEFHHWEASPPVFDTDGISIKSPAKMVACEELPLQDEVAEETDTDKPIKPKRRSKSKSRNKSEKHVSDEDDDEDTPTKVKEGKKSRATVKEGKNSRAKVKDGKPTKKTPPKEKGSTPKENAPGKKGRSSSKVPPSSRGSRQGVGGGKARGAASTDSDSEDSDSGTENIPDDDHRGGSIDPTLLEATKDMSLSSPVSGNSPEPSGISPAPRKGKGTTAAKTSKKVGPEKENSQKMTVVEDAGSDEDNGFGDAVSSNKNQEPTVKKKVQWSAENVTGDTGTEDDEEELADPGHARRRRRNPAVHTGLAGGAKAEATHARTKLSAEDLHLLEVANSDQYRVESPWQRARRKNSRYTGGA